MIDPNANSIDKHLPGFARIAQRIEAELGPWLKTQPQSLPCPRHPNFIRALDAAKSEWHASGSFRAAYQPCPLCAKEAATAREHARLHEQGVPSNLLNATLDNWTPRDDQERAHLEVVRAFLKVLRGFLILLGDVGVGKSHLAVGVLRICRYGRFVKQSTFLRQLRDTYRDRQAEDPIEAYQKAELLVLDEIGVTSGGRDEAPAIYEVLDYRYGERKPTILTANVSWDELKGILGNRMSDRLREAAFRILEFGGPSHRGEARDGYFKPTAVVTHDD
jgi:DNA replication protein DnaC